MKLNEEMFKFNAGFLVIVCLLMSQRLKPCFVGPLLGLSVQTLLICTSMANKLRRFIS